MDPGAVDNVSDLNLFPEYFIRQSEGSKRGLQYLVASRLILNVMRIAEYGTRYVQT